MSAEIYCPIYERLKENLNLKGETCAVAEGCPKSRKDCSILRDFRVDALKSKYASPEDIEQDKVLRQLEAAYAEANSGK
jgi:hypothetical protein